MKRFLIYQILISIVIFIGGLITVIDLRYSEWSNKLSYYADFLAGPLWNYDQEAVHTNIKLIMHAENDLFELKITDIDNKIYISEQNTAQKDQLDLILHRLHLTGHKIFTTPITIEGENIGTLHAVFCSNKTGPAIYLIILLLLGNGLVLSYRSLLIEREKLRHEVIEHKISEEKYKNLFNTSVVAIFQSRIEDGKVIEANERAIEMFGYRTREDVLSNMISAKHYVDPTARQKFIDALTANRTDTIEVEFVRLDGTRFWGMLSGRILQHENNQLIDAIIIDITEQKKAELLAEAAQNHLINSEKMATLGTLVSGIAHEVNNPLTIIKGLIGIASHHAVAKTSTELLDIFKKQDHACDRISTIIKGLRLYARPASDIIESVDIHKIIDDTMSLVKEIYHKEGINIILNYKASDPWVNGNNNKIQQVLMNILSNARDASEGRSNKRIIIKTQNSKNMLVLTIEDNGEGIDANHLSKIFDPFFTTKDPGKGAGLGLSICQAMITAMNGTIKISSQKDLGTSVSIELINKAVGPG